MNKTLIQQVLKLLSKILNIDIFQRKLSMYAQLLERYRKDISLYQLYLKKLPTNVRQSQIVNFFNKFVQVKSVRVFNRKERGQPCATIRFYDFDTMMKVYLKFGKDKSKDGQIYAQVSRKTLQICTKCSKVGHWSRECRQSDKYHRYEKRHTKDYNKSFEKMTLFQKSQSISESAQDLTKSRFSFYQQKQQQDEESLQYFCPELQLQQQPEPQLNDQKFIQKESFQKQIPLKQQEQDQLTQYEDSIQITQQSQKDLVFVNIFPEKPLMNFLSHQENLRLQTLWNSGWFEKIPDRIGSFVKIGKYFPHPLLNQ